VRFALHHTEPLSEGLRRLYDEQLAFARAQLASPDDGAVHETRKALKRLRSLLRFARGALDDDHRQRENVRFRTAGRLLSDERDAAVLIDTLDAVAEEPGAPTDALGPLRARLVADHAVVADPDRLARQAARADDLLAAAHPLPALPTDHDALLAGVARTYRAAARTLWEAAEAAWDPERDTDAAPWHEARKRAKDLWHHQQVLAVAWPPVLEAWAEEAHRHSALLGDHHDLAVLGGRLGLPTRIGAATPRIEPPAGGAATAAELDAAAARQLAEALARRQQRLEARALALGGRLLAERPRSHRRRLARLLAAHEADPLGPAPAWGAD